MDDLILSIHPQSKMDHSHSHLSQVHTDRMNMHGNHSCCMTMNMNMPMYFAWSTDVTVLFESWHVDTAGWFTVTAVIIFVAAFFYEWLLTFRHGFESRIRIKKSEEEIQEEEKLWVGIVSRRRPPRALHDNLHYFIATCLHILQLALAYGLMLVVMTYNIGLTIAVFAGAGLGYFLFARLRHTLLTNTAGCH
jgi:hypothetical protein